MKFENKHHVRAEDLTEELYHKFCQKVKGQGFDAGEYPVSDWMYYNYIGISNERIYHGTNVVFDDTEKLLTIEQALSTKEENTMSKARIIEIEQEPKFKPFKLEITIESEEDLINLWHRMDLYNKEVGSFYPSGRSKRITSKTNWEQSRIEEDVWQILDKKAKELGLRK